LFVLTWTLNDSQGNPINNAIVTATLYAGRSLRNPDGVPGIAINPINAVTLVYVALSAGQYAATIPGTLDPPLNGTGYVLVVDATVAGQPVYHSESPAVVETAGSNVDLTTVDQVKSWIPGLQASTSDDALIQACITAWGFEWLQRTGMGNQSGDFHQSPFNAICPFAETYDGCGTLRLFLRNRPIVDVTSLTINGVQIAKSSGFSSAGFVIDGARKSIALRVGLGWGNLWQSWQAGSYRAFGGLRFWQGIQNVEVQYTAGYNDTPADIVQCANKVVQLNYKRRSYADERTRAMAGGGGTISFRDWDIPVECLFVVDRYSRTL
jgi:hypothetical protein